MTEATPPLVTSIMQLLTALVFYFYMSYIGMRKVLEFDCQRDFLKFKKFEWATTIANIIPFLVVTIRLFRSKMHPIHIQRAAAMYILKAIIQFVTIVPAVSGTEECQGRGILGIIINFGNCADMMFSGHTAITYIMAPEKLKWIFVIPVGLLLVLGEMHYTSDIIVAIIIASWLEFMIVPENKDKPLIPTKNIV